MNWKMPIFNKIDVYNHKIPTKIQQVFSLQALGDNSEFYMKMQSGSENKG